MARNRTKWLAVGAVAFGLTIPFTVQARSDDEAVAFVVGAAVGYAIGNDRDRHTHVHRRDSRWVHYNPHPFGYDRRHARAHSKARARWHREAGGHRALRCSRAGHHRDRGYHGRTRYENDHRRDDRGAYRRG